MRGVVTEEGLHASAACRIHHDHLNDLLALDERVWGDGKGRARAGTRQDGQMGLSAGWSQRGAELVRLKPVVN